jgi:class 3 adenylate cyclase
MDLRSKNGGADGAATVRGPPACPACLRTPPEGSRFCPGCGTKLPNVPAQAERRQMSVMFTDIVDYTAIASRLDPEELRELIYGYQSRVARALREHGGFAARYVGDGVLAYFGWPLAGEIDAESAVRAALAIIRGFQDDSSGSERLHVRIAVATGLVVVGGTNDNDAARHAIAFGETPNRAARLQAAAGADCAIIDDATHQQIGALFDCEDIGFVTLKGFPEPARAWRVLSERPIDNRFEALHDGGATPMVGRDPELQTLIELWGGALRCRGEFVLVSGEAGIGKSRLIAALEQHLMAASFMCLRFFCFRDRQDSALHPVIAALTQAAALGRQDTPEDKLRKISAMLAADTRQSKPTKNADFDEQVALIADLLSVPLVDHQALNYSPQRRKERTFAAVISHIINLAQRRPLLIIFEDIHWADPTSIELIDRIVPRLVGVPIMLVLTSRSDETLPWIGQPNARLVNLQRLPTRTAALVAMQVSPDTVLPPDVLNRIVARSDGVPLFIEELTKTVVAQARSSQKMTEEITVPPTLRASLMSRLDRLPNGKHVAQVGSAIGREFAHSMLSRVAAIPPDVLAHGLDDLLRGGFIFPQGRGSETIYCFKHVLVQEAAYQSLLRARRGEIHAAIIRELERDPGIEGPQPALLGYHCAQAGLIEKATNYYRLAGERSEARAALAETRALLDRGISLAELLPDSSESRRLRAEALVSLARILHMTRSPSDPEALAAFEKAINLSKTVENPEFLTRALVTRFLNLWRRGSYLAAQQDAQQLIDVGCSRHDPNALILGHITSSYIHAILGLFSEASTDVATAECLLAEYPDAGIDISFGASVLTNGLIFGAFSHACLGYIDQAMAEAATIVGRINGLTPFARAAAMLLLSRFAFIICDRDSFRMHTDALTQISEVCGFTDFLNAAQVGHGWLLVTEGRFSSGLDEMRASMNAMKVADYRAFGPYWRLMMADALTRAAKPADALGLVDEALLLSCQTQEAWLDAELYRRKGNLILQVAPADATAAEVSLQRAITISRSQRARFFELRAATDLARIWLSKGQHVEARRLMNHTCSWFDQTTSAWDFGQARRLLAELEASLANISDS